MAAPGSPPILPKFCSVFRADAPLALLTMKDNPSDPRAVVQRFLEAHEPSDEVIRGWMRDVATSGRNVEITGCIGAGKSTFLKDTIPYGMLEVLDEKEGVYEPLLPVFRDNPQLGAASLQYAMLAVGAVYGMIPRKGMICAGGIRGNRVYAAVSVRNGLLGEEQMKSYQSVVSTMMENARPIPVTRLHLYAKPETAITRVRKRNRPGEEVLPIDYLAELDIAHLAFVISDLASGESVVVVDWNSDEAFLGALPGKKGHDRFSAVWAILAWVVSHPSVVKVRAPDGVDAMDVSSVIEWLDRVGKEGTDQIWQRVLATSLWSSGFVLDLTDFQGTTKE